jgi:hypothetical protein
MEKKKGGVQDGPGTTNKDVGPQKFDTHKDGKSEYIEDRTKAKYEELYKGQRENVKTEPLFLDNKWNDDSDRRYVNIRTFGVNKDSNAGANGAAANGQDSQESAIRKERIPASYGKIVKQYFESIKDND